MFNHTGGHRAHGRPHVALILKPLASGESSRGATGAGGWTSTVPNQEGMVANSPELKSLRSNPHAASMLHSVKFLLKTVGCDQAPQKNPPAPEVPRALCRLV